MPRMLAELAQGQAFSRTSEENTTNDTFTRTFRVMLVTPNEVFDPQAYCGIYVGDRHPYNLNLICHSFDAKFEGESRLVTLITFNYRSFASTSASANRPDPKTTEPAVRPANWTTDTTLTEVPATTWVLCDKATGNRAGNANWSIPRNPVGDRYEGVSKLVPITTIRVEQFEQVDPLRWSAYAGYINDSNMTFGVQTFLKHTVMFRGVSCKPHVETFRDVTYRGWMATFEFQQKNNDVLLESEDGAGNPTRVDVGWDRLQVVEGYNVMNKAALLNAANVDPFGMALKHAAGQVVIPLTVVDGTDNKRVRAMVGIPSMDAQGGMFQRPASAPVALNLDGTPRLVFPVEANSLRPIVQRYQVQNDINLVATLGLRLL